MDERNLDGTPPRRLDHNRARGRLGRRQGRPPTPTPPPSPGLGPGGFRALIAHHFRPAGSPAPRGRAGDSRRGARARFAGIADMSDKDRAGRRLALTSPPLFARRARSGPSFAGRLDGSQRDQTHGDARARSLTTRAAYELVDANQTSPSPHHHLPNRGPHTCPPEPPSPHKTTHIPNRPPISPPAPSQRLLPRRPASPSRRASSLAPATPPAAPRHSSAPRLFSPQLLLPRLQPLLPRRSSFRATQPPRAPQPLLPRRPSSRATQPPRAPQPLLPRRPPPAPPNLLPRPNLSSRAAPPPAPPQGMTASGTAQAIRWRRVPGTAVVLVLVPNLSTAC